MNGVHSLVFVQGSLATRTRHNRLLGGNFELQGVVTCSRLMKRLQPGSRILISQKCACFSLLRLLITWFSKGQRSNCSRTLDQLILQFWGHLDPLIGPQKGLWSLDSILILVTNTSTLDICDYPLNYLRVQNLPDLQVPSSAITAARNCPNIKNPSTMSGTCM